jgi:hypothetical protein
MKQYLREQKKWVSEEEYKEFHRKDHLRRILAKRNRIKKRAIPKFHYPKCVRDLKDLTKKYEFANLKLS